MPRKNLNDLNFGTAFGSSDVLRQSAEVAVVIPTTGRPQLASALRSVFSQTLPGPIQVLIGVDGGGEIPESLRDVMAEMPEWISMYVLHLPYSTSRRHGGMHPARDGGALRTILTFMANSRYVAYLDDDNQWLPNHLHLLRKHITGLNFAFSHRLIIDEEDNENLGPDIWDSTGPGSGRFSAVGGFVDPSCLMVDKIKLGPALHRWSDTPTGEPLPGSDVWFFQAIASLSHAAISEPTVRYSTRRDNILQRFVREGISPAAAIRDFPPLKPMFRKV